MDDMRRRITIHYSKHGIRSLILYGFTIFVIVPFIALVLISYSVLKQYADRSYSENMLETLASAATQIDNSMEKYREATMTLYYNGTVDLLDHPRTERGEQQINSSLNSLCYSYSGVIASYLICGSDVYHQGSSNYSQIVASMLPHRDEIMENDGHSIWYEINNTYPEYGSTYKYLLARSLNSSKQKNIAVLYLIVNSKMISSSQEKLNTGNTTKYMVTPDGRILYSSQKEKTGKTFDMTQITPKNEKGYALGTMDGEENLIVYYRLQSSNWTLISTIPVAEMLNGLTPIRQVIGIISVVYLLFLFFMFLLLQRCVFHPLDRMISVTDQFAKGDRNIRIRFESVKEIQKLSDHFNEMISDIGDLMAKNEKEIREKNDFKMQALLAQLNPHFIYNSLNTIRWMAVINKQNNIRMLTDSLIYILMNATKTNQDDYTLQNELDLIRNYVVIQKARFMNFQLVVDSDDRAKNCIIPKFLIQPVVENAIVHGFGKGKEPGGTITIQVRRGVDLRISVEDNGTGFDVSQWRANESPVKPMHSNIGLRNIEQIISLQYGSPYGLTVTSEKGKGTVVRYRLPAVEKDGSA